MGANSSWCNDDQSKHIGFDNQQQKLSANKNTNYRKNPNRVPEVQILYQNFIKQKPFDYSVEANKQLYQPMAITILGQTGTYVGEIKDNKPHGVGQVYFENDNFLQTIFVQGKIQSDDTLYIEKNGDSYRGGFQGSGKVGNGIMRASSQFYQGRFSKDRLEGKGQLKFTDGRTYSGNFNNGKMEGKGRLVQKNGDIYVGFFKKGKKNGLGYYKSDLYQYFGPFENDQKQGKGTLFFKGKGKFEGWFQKDMIDGYGQWHKANGSIQKKVYRNEKISDFFN